ncbi:histone-lysine N-methyltransferase SMYD3-like [Oppia nitens]|uniref:histone-lysine N-methyltransferase SMYD3-like n=1 Tax=Oppia nitens TaxID=1686743 RepID=UPI0023DB2C2A|nr:histone-lysine N-methyltransferase SMYD3-like [Oppia nitens]
MGFNCGDVIVRCRPLVHTLSADQKSKRCDHCFKQRDQLQKCSNCKSMYYCDRRCQRQDWSGGCHRNECPVFSCGGGGGGGDDGVNQWLMDRDCDRFLLRLYLLTTTSTGCLTDSQKAGGGDDDHQLRRHKLDDDGCGRSSRRSLGDLMTHYDEVAADTNRMRYFTEMSKRFTASGIDFDGELLFELFCKVCINSFSILNDELNPIGSGLYLSGSQFNHSCRPNAATVFNGTELEVRAVRQISDTDEILVNYLDLKMSATERRRKLREQYYFDCNCCQCLSSLASLTSTSSSPITDPQQQQQQQQLIDNALAIKQLDQEFDRLIDSKNDWQKCMQIGLETLPLYRQCYGDYHPDLTVQLVRVLKVMLLVVNNNNTMILDMIKTVRNAIEITHGLHNNLFNIFNLTYNPLMAIDEDRVYKRA